VIATNDVFLLLLTLYSSAVAHAMARDGSSGGVIRLCVIDQSGVQKQVILGEVSSLTFCIY